MNLTRRGGQGMSEPSKVVYVGHLPFDMTEEQIKDIFKTAGPVKEIRLVFDRATGKSKGFAFVQYYQIESAESAVRNLDKHKVGNKQLKVNYSSGKSFEGKDGRGGNNNGPGGGPGAADEMSGIVPEIVEFVATIPAPQKQQILNELKSLITERPEAAQKFLQDNPQVTYAVVQSMFELGLIDGNAAGSLIIDTEQPQPAAQPAQVQPAKKKRRQEEVPALTTPRPGLSEDQKQMYRQIMALTPQQLQSMPNDQQQAAQKIRQQVESGMIVL